VFQFQEIKRRKIEETGSRKREIKLLDYEATNRPAGVRKKTNQPTSTSIFFAGRIK
jgi:hypothetical protein